MPDFAQPAWLLLLLAVPVLMLLRLRAAVVEGRVKRLLGSLLRCLALVALIVALAGPLKSSYSRHTAFAGIAVER